jgi:hypothetical protein
MRADVLIRHDGFKALFDNLEKIFRLRSSLKKRQNIGTGDYQSGKQQVAVFRAAKHIPKNVVVGQSQVHA